MTLEENISTRHKNAKMFSLRSILDHVKLPGLSLPTRKFFTLHNILGYPLRGDPNVTIRETAWLDGLRGVAAFLVMVYHFNLTFWFPPNIEAPYMATDLYWFRETGEVIIYTALWRLPFIRVLMTAGHAQVSIFFVLSGFVLSWGPLGSIRTGQKEKFASSLGSAVFRRWMRLYLPCFAISLWQALEVYFDLRFVGGKEAKSNIFAQIWDWVIDSERFANPFMIDRDKYTSLHAYDWTMWTIPYEFAGSLMVFGVLLAIGRFKRNSKRMLVVFGVTAYACLRAAWTYWLFASGMLLACYVRSQGGFGALTPSLRSRVAWIVVLLLGLLMAGVPEATEYYDRPGYEWLLHLTPPNYREIEGGGRWVWNWSGIVFILAACHLPRMQRVFELSFMRYLGRISYMLYLTHRVTHNLFGERVKVLVMDVFGRIRWIDKTKDGSPTSELITAVIYFVIMIIIIPVSLVVAHWTEVLIDGPSTRLARRVDEWFAKGDEVVGNGSILPSSHGRGHAHTESVDRGIEMQNTAAPGRESVSREEGTGLLFEQEAEMREIDPRPLPDR